MKISSVRARFAAAGREDAVRAARETRVAPLIFTRIARKYFRAVVDPTRIQACSF